MAGRTITQRIAFTGGEEMKVQLTNIGQAGQTAFRRLQDAGDAASGIGAKLLPVLQSIKAKLKEVQDAAANVGDKFGKLGDTVATSARRIALIATAVTGAVAGFAALVLGAGKATEEIELAAKAAGLTTTQFQDLQNAFNIAGIEDNGLSALLNKMNKTLGDSTKQALQTQKKYRDLNTEFVRGKITSEDYLQRQQDIGTEAREQINVFTRLGVSAETAMNDPREALLQFADAFAALPDGIEKSALELEVFGRNGTKLASTLADGRAGLIALEQEAQRVAPALTKIELAVGQKLDDAFDKLGLAITNTRQRFLLLFGPALTKIIDAFTNLIVANRDKLIAFGKSIVAAIEPVINDLIALLQGKEIDPTSFVARVAAAVTKFAADVKTAIGIAIAAWNGFVTVLDQVANIINNVFGTNITGQALAFAAVIGTVTGAFSVLFAAVGAAVSVIGLLAAIFGGVNVALVALGVTIGFVFTKLLVAALEAIPGLAASAWQALLDGFAGTVKNFEALFAGLGEVARAVWQLMVDTALGAWTAILESVSALGEGLKVAFTAVIEFFVNGFQAGIAAVKGFFADLGSFASGILNGIMSFINSIISAAKSALSAVSKIGGGDTPAFSRGGPVRAAGGGFIRGPGTSISDSILAWLSDQEFVIKARAVKHYGVQFMQRVNNMTLPKQAIQGFNAGGLVSALQSFVPIPRFAGGGEVAPAMASGPTGRPFTLQIGGETFGGLTAEQNTFDSLQRFAVRRHVQSAGRKPSWVK